MPLPVEIEIERGGATFWSRTNHRLLLTLPAEAPVARPFLKWAGGKQWMVPVAAAFRGATFGGTYYEPFLGGGAMFFALSPPKSRLSDLNAELVETYRAVRADVEGVIKTLSSYRYDKVVFEKLRSRRPRTQTSLAARFIYLNRTAFNGLYRVNVQGRFNVPFGTFENPTICQRDRLEESSSALAESDLASSDFEVALQEARKGDFVYLDPPYVSGHTDNGFLRYNARLFSWSDQLRLARAAHRLDKRGVSVVVTNADFPAVTSLYTGFFHYSVRRKSLIGAPGTRGLVRESVLSNFPVAGLPSLRIAS